MNEFNFIVTKENVGTRLDKFLALVLQDVSRSSIQNIIDEGKILVNNKEKKSNYKLKEKDFVLVNIPEPRELNVEPENIPIEIMYEDSDIIVVNKPQGMVVHPAPGVYNGTLVNALLYHCHDLSGINGILRPGIVHRIDKDTSGILVVAKNDYSHNKLAEQLKEHSMKREYYAVTEGVLRQDEGTINEPLGRHPVERIKIAVIIDGREAITHYKVIERYKNNTLVKCILETGRTHQIRVHMSHIGHPLLGDPVYGFKKQRFNLQGQLLHAKILGFIHPTKNTYMQFESELPDYYVNVLNILSKELK